MVLLSLDRHDVLETIRQSNSLHEAFLRVAKLPATGDYKTADNADHAADVRPVVRCKDCRHRDPEDHKCDSGQTERQGCPFKVADDYFCAYGER